MILFFYGEDTFSLVEELKATKEKFLQKNPSAAFHELEIRPEMTDQVLSERLEELLISRELFSKQKLVILRNFSGQIYQYSQSESFLTNTLKSLPVGVSVVFVETQPFDKRLRFFKILQTLAKIKEFTVPTGLTLEAWIKSYLRKDGFEIEKVALQDLLELIGEDYTLWQIEGELNKLMLYCWQDKIIKAPHVRESISRNPAQNIFDLTNLVAAGEISQALLVLEQMLWGAGSTDQKSQVIQVVGALAGQLRSLLLVKELEESDSAEIARILDWKEGRVWINQKLAKKFSQERLLQLLKDLHAIDFRLKTSEESPKLLLSLLFQKSVNPSTLTAGHSQQGAGVNHG